jgi:hypothetical protein
MNKTSWEISKKIDTNGWVKTNLRVIWCKVCTDEVPSNPTHDVNDSCTHPTKTLLDVTQDKETEQQ